MSPSHRTIPMLALALASSGCCSMARFFCGPDRTPWVHVSYDTPQEALATFKEAVRREDTLVIFRSLSEDFKQRSGLTGWVEADLAWEEIREKVDGVHMLGYAEASEPKVVGHDRVALTLEISGYRIGLEFVRQAYWECRYPGLYEDGAPVDSLRNYVTITPDADAGTTDIVVQLKDLEIEHMDLRKLVRFEVGSEWKLDHIDNLDASVDASS